MFGTVFTDSTVINSWISFLYRYLKRGFVLYPFHKMLGQDIISSFADESLKYWSNYHILFAEDLFMAMHIRIQEIIRYK